MHGVEPAGAFPVVVGLPRERAPAWRVLGDHAVAGAGPDHLAARNDEGAEAFLGTAQRILGLDPLGDVFVHKNDFHHAPGSIDDRLRARGDPARPRDDAQIGGVVQDGRNVDRFASERAQQVGGDALGLQLRVGQHVVPAVQNVLLERIAQRALPHRFPSLVHLQGAAVGGQQLHADRGLVEDFAEPDI